MRMEREIKKMGAGKIKRSQSQGLRRALGPGQLGGAFRKAWTLGDVLQRRGGWGGWGWGGQKGNAAVREVQCPSLGCLTNSHRVVA